MPASLTYLGPLTKIVRGSAALLSRTLLTESNAPFDPAGVGALNRYVVTTIRHVRRHKFGAGCRSFLFNILGIGLG